jgi:acetyl esterase/lipase
MFHRRSVLIAGAGLIAAPLLAAGPVAQRIPLWPQSPPGGGGPSGPVNVDKRGAIKNIAVPTVEVFAPTKPTGAAMLVAAGGGYRHIEMETEAYPAARWLIARGITAFVLAYRLPSEGWSAGPMVSLQDAQRALRLIRARASAYRLHPGRVGVLGFSSGGHLMGLTSTRSEFRSYADIDAASHLSARPDVAALIYPIITLEPPYDHTSTRSRLIGQHPTPAQSKEWSVQTHVGRDCPPMFLAQAEDDPISNPANTVIMAEACEREEVPVELHKIPSGGHGFGMGKPGTPTAAWPGWYETWLRARAMIT